MRLSFFLLLSMAAFAQSRLTTPVTCLPKADHSAGCSLIIDNADTTTPLTLQFDRINAASINTVMRIIGAVGADGRIELTPGVGGGKTYVQVDGNLNPDSTPGRSIGDPAVARWPFFYGNQVDLNSTASGTALTIRSGANEGLDILTVGNTNSAVIQGSATSTAVLLVSANGASAPAIMSQGDLVPQANGSFTNGRTGLRWIDTYTQALDANNLVTFSLLGGSGDQPVCTNNTGILNNTCGSLGGFVTISTNQNVNSTKTFLQNQIMEAQLQFYNGASGPQYSLSSTTNNTLGFRDSSSNLTAYIDSSGAPSVGGSGVDFVLPSIYAASTAANSPAAIIQGFSGQTADLLDVQTAAAAKQFAVTAAGVIQYNGASGQSVTVTVRNSAGTGTCTLIFTAGGKTGGTC